MDERVGNASRRTSDLLTTQPDSASIAEQLLATVPQMHGRTRLCSELEFPRRHSDISRYLLMAPIFPQRAGQRRSGDSTGRRAVDLLTVRIGRIGGMGIVRIGGAVTKFAKK